MHKDAANSRWTLIGVRALHPLWWVVRTALGALLVGLLAPTIHASELVTYTYDPLGRLVASSITGGFYNGLQTSVSYDPAGNRSNYAMSGSPPAPSLAISNASVTEGGALVFTVTKTGTGVASVSWTTANGSATAGSDYTAARGTISFAIAETSKTISVATIDDATVESAETLTVTLSSPPSGVTIGSAVGTGTISDNDVVLPSFSISSAPTVTEGGTLVFTVTKNGTTTGTFSVNFASANGTAVSGSDYTATNGTLTFAPNETSKTISVVTIDDASVESAETVLVDLSGASGGATISAGQASGTINDNDPPPSFAIANAPAITEGGTLVFTVTKTGTTNLNYSVNFATANGTAASGSDYTATSGTLTFAANETSRTISVGTTGDFTLESAETMLVNLSSATGGAAITRSQASGTINDDDYPPPSFSIANAATVNEGGTLVFTVTKIGTTNTSYNVNFATANGSATAGSDYTAASGTLTFGVNETSKTIGVATTDDTSTEGAETVLVNLSSPTGGATITTGQGSGTINASDPNSPPLPSPDFLQLSQDNPGSINVVANDTDPEGNYPLALVSVSDPSGHASISGTTNVAFSGTSIGTYVVQYTVRDSLGATAVGTLTVNVACQTDNCNGGPIE